MKGSYVIGDWGGTRLRLWKVEDGQVSKRRSMLVGEAKTDSDGNSSTDCERLRITGKAVLSQSECPAVYRYFADLLNVGRSALDLQPLIIALDAIEVGSIDSAPAFHWSA